MMMMAAEAAPSPPSDAPPPPSSSPPDAAGIIKLIGASAAEASASAAAAAGEAEEARRNARAASEVARRFMGGGGGGLAAGSIGIGISPRSYLAAASPRSPLSLSMNGDGHSRSSTPGSAGGGGFSSSAGFFGRRRRTPTGAAAGSANGSGAPAPYHPPALLLPPRGAGAPSGADELVSLALELERTQQALEAEQMRHDETKSALQHAGARAAQLEGQLEKLLGDVETQRETLGRRADALEHELARARMLLEAAEEDANLALEIARDNDRRREEAEALLPEARREIEDLKSQVAVLSRAPRAAAPPARPRPPPPPPPPPPPLPNQPAAPPAIEADAHKRPSPKSVRFADGGDPARRWAGTPEGSAATAGTSSTGRAVAAPASPSSRLDRSLVATGRELLRRSAAAGADAVAGSSALARDLLEGGELSVEVLAEKRKRLRDRVRALDELANGSPSHQSFSTASSLPSSPFSPLSSPLRGIESLLAASAESAQRDAAIRASASMLRASGRRLGLTGRWWNEPSAPPSSADAGGGASTPRKDAAAAAAAAASTPDSIATNAAAASSHSRVALETLTRHYCTSVEVLIDRKQKEIVELESLCALWEEQGGVD